MSNKKAGFTTPPGHVNFSAKKLFGEQAGILTDGAIAYLEVNGGGPTTLHTHAHDHLFMVISGEARIEMPDKSVIVRANEACRVKGSIPHAIWNNASNRTVMVGLTLK